MKRPPEIKINRFQLAVLLNQEQKEIMDRIIADNVFCGACGGTCSKGITVREIFLTGLNDILVKGNCNTCNGNVARMLEFGEDKSFFEKANSFRKSINN